MRWLGIVVALALGGCAALSNFQQVATSSVSPTQALLAANGFNAAESGATAFLTFCKASPEASACNANTRRLVIRYVRAGRAARNQIETYIQTSTTVPAAIYNALVAALDNIKNTPASNFIGAH